MHPDSRLQPRPPERLTALPSWQLSQVAQYAHRLVSSALAEADVRKHHFTVLLALDEHGTSSQAALGRRLGIDRSDLHAVLNDLEGDGLVARRQVEHDRRRNTVELTAAGREALPRLDARVHAAQEALLEPLSSAERTRLLDALSRLVEHHAGAAR
jgi:DNA-binding MarR family transcriptional regulator